MSPEDKAFARDWYERKLTVEEMAAKWKMTEAGVRVRAVNRLTLGPRDIDGGNSRPDGSPNSGRKGWIGCYQGSVPDRRKEVGL